MQAAEANAALGVLAERLEGAGSQAERVAAFEAAYRHVAEWRYQVAVQGQWTRPYADADDVRATIGEGGYMRYRLSPGTGGREPGSPAWKLLSELEQVALERMGQDHHLQNVVTLRDGTTVNGNQLHYIAAPRDPSTGEPYPGHADQVITQTAAYADREVLRRASFEALAELEGARAEGTADVQDPAQRQAFADAAYFLVQGPEFRRGSDAIMRTFLATAHTRVFDAAPVLPQAVDLDGMVRGQEGFNRVMHEQLRLAPAPTVNEPAAATTERATPTRTRPDGLTR
ncbi:hypothetical protein EV651_105342 [Kribbella sp. VKM Ac-2571]|uniref:hypothetical protein n=1 Tax=Kribbella sp. VKM Ac-2571 TaxID=2512222 RepID=UPI00105E5F83|nr:hypothetical protein [Kribbella sp. VKM Ac-2571]TDO64118.1 hypothetical protein EV651_105342 [Kribbella sp. VKM Ac-2571]